MTETESQLLTYLLLVISGFIFLLFLLLKIRENQVSKNLQTSASSVWESIRKEATKIGLNQSHLLYGIYQDKSMTQVSMVIRNGQGEDVGTIIFQTAVRKRQMTIRGQHLTIEFPLTMNKQAILKRNEVAIATYEKRNWQNPVITLSGQNKLVMTRKIFSSRATCTYKKSDRDIGIVQNISSNMSAGRAGVFSDSIPLEVQIFLLSL